MGLGPASRWEVRDRLRRSGVSGDRRDRPGLCRPDLRSEADADRRRAGDGAPDRLHAAAWAGWWLVSGLSMLLLAVARGVPAWMRCLSLACATALPVLLVFMPMVGHAGLAQRLAIAVWLVWWWMLAAGFHRYVAKSSPT